VRSYFKANPGTPFILGFMVLLISAAALLIANKTNEANSIAEYAFYSLVLGIVIQVGIVVREGKRHPRSNGNRPSDSS
jgi:hypothetical protein